MTIVTVTIASAIPITITITLANTITNYWYYHYYLTWHPQFLFLGGVPPQIYLVLGLDRHKLSSWSLMVLIGEPRPPVAEAFLSGIGHKGTPNLWEKRPRRVAARKPKRRFGSLSQHQPPLMDGSTDIATYTDTDVNIDEDADIHIDINTCIYVCICIYVYVQICVYLYVCRYTYRHRN